MTNKRRNQITNAIQATTDGEATNVNSIIRDVAAYLKESYFDCSKDVRTVLAELGWI